MKISKLFHWLYAAVMFIPLVVIPVFAIYSRNENAQFGYEVTQEVNKVVDFNQIVKDEIFNDSNNSNYWSNYSSSSTTLTFNDNSMTLTSVNGSNSYYTYGFFQNNVTSTLNHKYLIKVQLKSSVSKDFRCEFNNNNTPNQTINANVIETFEQILTITSVRNDRRILMYATTPYSTDEYYTIYSFNIFDLTQMGLENVTIEEFNTYFSNGFYPYTESQEVVIENYETITYNDTDIGSQFLYAMYIPISNYFNVSQLPVFNSMFQWFSYNIFGATAPMWFFIAYNLMMYWLIISLFWLIFDVLMYVPSMVHKMLDKARLE